MARTSNERTVILEDILKKFAPQAVVLNTIDSAYADNFQNNAVLEVQKLATDAKVRDVTDVDGLEAAPTDFGQATTTSDTWRINYVQGYAEVNLRKAREMKAGQAARELQMNTAISLALAEDADKKGVATIKGNTYNNASKNLHTAGSSTNYIKRDGNEVEASSGALGNSINQALRAVKRRYANLSVQGGVDVTGAGQIPAFSYFCNIAVADYYAEWLANRSQLRNINDLAVSALVNRGVFGTEAYRGTSVGGFNIVGVPDSVLAPPTEANPWDTYVIPSTGAMSGTFQLDPDSQGTYRVDGTHIERRVETGLVGYKIWEPTWLQKINIQGQA